MDVNRDKKNDERFGRDRRAARLRDGYIRVLHAARSMRWAASELKVVWEGETVEDRNARVNTVLVQDARRADDAVTRLMLERGADDVLQATEDVVKALFDFRLGLWENSQIPGSVKLGEVEKQLAAAVDRVLQGAQRHLDQVEAPL